jgi:ATP-dependent helicase HrpA
MSGSVFEVKSKSSKKNISKVNTDNTDVKWDLRPFDKLDKIGVLDPKGDNPNPLTGEDYSDEYKLSFNNDRHWSKLPFNEPNAQKKTFTILQKNQVILVKSGTGSGKSSQVPKFLTHLLGYRGRIAITIPTQISTYGSAEYMAKAFDVKIGEEVGYKFRGKSMIDQGGKKSRIVFTTDGTILAQLLGTNPDLSDLNALVIDEAHKRSSNIDMILLLVKVLLTRRPDFKLLIISATINAELFKKYFPSPDYKFAEVEVTSNPPFPITDVWESRPLIMNSNYYIPLAVEKVMNILTNTTKGDLLVFLPTVTDLNQACKMLEEENKSNLSFCVKASGDIFRSSANKKELVIEQQVNNIKRKVVMSTAVAEESITIKNIDFVVDTGLNLMSSYDALSMSNHLNLEFITKSSVKQRAGRTGRLQAGTAYHLYTKKQFEEFPEFDIPEIKKINMAEIFLKITNMPLIKTYKKAMVFLDNLIEPPTREALLSGANQLKELGAFTKSDPKDMGELSIIGKAMSELGTDPGVAKTLLMANQYFVRKKACELYGILEATKGRGLSDIYMNHRDKRDKYEKVSKFLDKKGDYFTLLNIYTKFEDYRSKNSWDETIKWCKSNYIRHYPLTQVKQAKFRLLRNLSSVTDNEELKEALKKEETGDYKTDDTRLLHSIREGEGKIRNAILKRGDKYETQFPPKKLMV